MDCQLSEIKSELKRCWQSSQYYTANITYSILSVCSLNGLFWSDFIDNTQKFIKVYFLTSIWPMACCCRQSEQLLGRSGHRRPNLAHQIRPQGDPDKWWRHKLSLGYETVLLLELKTRLHTTQIRKINSPVSKLYSSELHSQTPSHFPWNTILYTDCEKFIVAILHHLKSLPMHFLKDLQVKWHVWNRANPTHLSRLRFKDQRWGYP